jgi:nucleoprotein TPR
MRANEEISLLASQLAQAAAGRDDFARLVREEAANSKKVAEENTIIQRQLTDLGRQVQGLLREIALRDNPSLENVEFDEVPTSTEEETDSDKVITDNLVLFKNLPHLQQQNHRLLRTARGLAAQWEERQATLEAQLSKEETAALAEASEAVRDMEEELQRQKLLVSTHQKERDMYRNILARQGKDVGGGPAQSGHPSTSDGLRTTIDYRTMLEEQQALFETFKLEMGVDTTKLKEDLNAAQREVGHQGASLAKANAQIEFLQGWSIPWDRR